VNNLIRYQLIDCLRRIQNMLLSSIYNKGVEKAKVRIPLRDIRRL
jgi:hypothetical protein